MAHVAMTMNAIAVHGMEETCAGCFRKFRRAERMNAVEHSDGSSLGWHCDGCMDLWKQKGETALPRWNQDEESLHAPA